ncbi:MAG TPA: hypothetical protein V6C46_08770 [Coleofasciculaceae cyanobacterium]
MAILFIKSLTCNETEDTFGSDECLMEVFTNAGRKTYRQDMNNGEVFEINDELPFTARAKVKLWDLDLGRWPDYNDHLGTVVIRDTPVQNSSASFTLDGADYVLTYDVRRQ